MNRFLFFLLFVLLVDHSPTVVAKSRKKKQTTAPTSTAIKKAEEYALSTGLKLTFSDSKSASTLRRWAKDLDSAGGSVTHHTAVYREQDVVRKVESGEWSPVSYAEYQRLAAGSGNVDSARLILDFGVGATIQELSLQSKSSLGKLFVAISRCDDMEYDRLLRDYEELEVTSVADDGTTTLIAAAFNNCLNIIKKILSDSHQDSSTIDVDATALNGATALMTAAARGHTDAVRLLVTLGHANVHIKHKFAGNTALHMAAELSQFACVRALCQLGADRQALTSTGSTPLHVAAHAGACNETIRALIKDCQCDPDALMNGDTTAVYLAAQFGYTHTLTALLQHGASHSFAMPSTVYQGERFLTKTGSDSTLDYATGPPINSEPGNGAMAIHAAAENGHASAVLALLDGGVDIDSFSMGVSPLHLATQYNRTTVVQALLQRGANVDLLSQNDGATALYYASGHHYVEVARLLLAAGASPHLRQSRAGGFPLLYASMTGDLSMVRLLLEYHARVLDQAPDGLRPLHAACAVGAVPVVRALLTPTIAGGSTTSAGNMDNWVSPSQILLAPGPHGQSALHVSVSSRMNPVTYLLLQHARTIQNTLHTNATHNNRDKDSGSDDDENESFTLSSFVEMRDDLEGMTALHIAARQGGQNPDAISLLIAFGADVEAVMDGDDAHCETPLYLAAQSGSAVAVSLLLSAGATVHTQLCGSVGATPLLAAIEHGHTEVVQTLLQPEIYIPKWLNVSMAKVGGNRQSNSTTTTNKKNKNGQTDVTGRDGDVDGVSESETGTRSGADPNRGIPNSGLTQAPLLLAVARGHSAIAKALLDAGALCNILVATGRHPNDAKKKETRLAAETLVEVVRRRRDFDTLQVLMSYDRCDPEAIHRQAEIDAENLAAAGES